MDLNYAKHLLEKTKEDYQKIAKNFSQKRSYIPQDFLYLKKFIQKGDRILDLGCGNGRLYEIKNETEYFGVDFSEKMIEIAKKRYPQGKFLVADAFSLPFKDHFFDKVFCLSVFHHIPSKFYREQFLKETKRVLKKDGLLVLTVWNLLPKRKTKSLLLKYTFLKLIGKSKLDFFDIFLPWRDSKGEVVIERYLHIFTLNSLKKTIKKAGFEVLEAKILKRTERESNLLILAQHSLHDM
ncbi:MAG: class I SAM-dependent methyltransferase [Candidatus Pacebacteria bacterium]|nr:class I SAM-dependent methyltransferase [Candidatus Paceibacterota bacterium]